MAGITLTGTLIKKKPIENIPTKNGDMEKREFWMRIDEDSEYPQTIRLDLIKDRCSLVEKYKEGDVIEADINIRGRQVTIKKTGEEAVFNELNVWRIRGLAESTHTASETRGTGQESNGEDDLPF